MTGFVPERRAPLLLLFVLTGLLAMLAYQVRTEQGTMLGRGVRTLVSPVIWAASAVAGGIGGTWDSYIGLRGARESAREAARERDEARALALLAEEALRENRRLRALLHLRQRLVDDRDVVAARVIGGGGDVLDEGLLIDRGTRHGIVSGSPVVAAGGPAGGLVGRVVFASPWQARVQLLTDRSASVAVRDQEQRVQGVVRGQGRRQCSFQWIDRPEDVRPGSLLVTSGLDGLYPRGLAVAYLREPRGAVGYGTGLPAHPVLDLLAVEEVLVLPPLSPGRPAPEAFSDGLPPASPDAAPDLSPDDAPDPAPEPEATS